MKASDYIVEYLGKNASPKIFGYIGGMIAHIADSVARSRNLEFISMINEQGAAFAAEGYARASGRIGVAVATSGPGATNLLTGIGSCYFDSVPVVFITGQVNTYEFKGKLPIRQRGFQETEIAKMAVPITKYSSYVGNVADLRYELEKAVYISTNGRKGPVLLDIPMDVQRMDLDFSKQKSFFDGSEYIELSKKCEIDNADIYLVAEKLKSAKRPVILLGGGVRLANVSKRVCKFAEKNRIAVVESLLGRDSVPADASYNAGLIGVYANRYGNFALGNADFVLILGSRLDSRQTGTSPEIFLKGIETARVDIDENELKFSRIKVGLSILGDVGNFIDAIYDIDCRAKRKEWFDYIEKCKKAFPSSAFVQGGTNWGNLFIDKLSEVAKSASCITVDVGQNQMWTANPTLIMASSAFSFRGEWARWGLHFHALLVLQLQPVK